MTCPQKEDSAQEHPLHSNPMKPRLPVRLGLGQGQEVWSELQCSKHRHSKNGKGRSPQARPGLPGDHRPGQGFQESTGQDRASKYQ